MNAKTLTEIVRFFAENQPHEVKGTELCGWCGLEGTGFVAYGGDTTTQDDCVILDVAADGHTIHGEVYVAGELRQVITLTAVVSEVL